MIHVAGSGTGGTGLGGKSTSVPVEGGATCEGPPVGGDLNSDELGGTEGSKPRGVAIAGSMGGAMGVGSFGTWNAYATGGGVLLSRPVRFGLPGVPCRPLPPFGPNPVVIITP
jgi:hypothetical protein